MPAADQIPADADFTDAQSIAFQRHQDAMAAFTARCASPSSTTALRMAAAKVMAEAHNDMMEAFGASPRNMTDVHRVKHLEGAVGELTEMIRSAEAMVRGIHSIGSFAHRPDGEDRDDFCACATLLDDTHAVLGRALAKADAV